MANMLLLEPTATPCVSHFSFDHFAPVGRFICIGLDGGLIELHTRGSYFWKQSEQPFSGINYTGGYKITIRVVWPELTGSSRGYGYIGTNIRDHSLKGPDGSNKYIPGVQGQKPAEDRDGRRWPIGCGPEHIYSEYSGDHNERLCRQLKLFAPDLFPTGYNVKLAANWSRSSGIDLDDYIYSRSVQWAWRDYATADVVDVIADKRKMRSCFIEPGQVGGVGGVEWHVHVLIFIHGLLVRRNDNGGRVVPRAQITFEADPGTHAHAF
jgi:hypothetical protein